jgi:hypothetical protein
MNRMIVSLAVAALPLAACHKAPDVEYQQVGLETTQPAKTIDRAATSERPTAGLPRQASGVARFERDFGNQDRFAYEGQFRLDRWTGCVTDTRTGVPTLTDEGLPECGYIDRKVE